MQIITGDAAQQQGSAEGVEACSCEDSALGQSLPIGRCFTQIVYLIGGKAALTSSIEEMMGVCRISTKQ